MQFYLSSRKLGDSPEKLAQLMGPHPRVGYIPNALDHVTARAEWLSAHIQSDMASLNTLNLDTELLDLKTYFGNQDSLEEKLTQLEGIWVSGGNVFVLRQAMKLSGFDKAIFKIREDRNFVYGGYSAGCCVLSKTLHAYQIVDEPTASAYGAIGEVLWNGLGLIDFAFLLHYQSAHSESAGIDQEVNYCIQNQIPYKALSDGDVLIL